MPAEYFEARERALLGERYDTLYAAPLKISGAEGAPCRAVLISDEQEEPQA